MTTNKENYDAAVRKNPCIKIEVVCPQEGKSEKVAFSIDFNHIILTRKDVEDIYISRIWGEEKVHVGSFFERLIIGGKPRKLYKTIDGYDLTLVGCRSKEGELVIILTNTDMKSSMVLEIYKTRWMIECLFKNMKYNGFNLEDTHMTITQRLEKLMAVCSFAVALCH